MTDSDLPKLASLRKALEVIAQSALRLLSAQLDSTAIADAKEARNHIWKRDSFPSRIPGVPDIDMYAVALRELADKALSKFAILVFKWKSREPVKFNSEGDLKWTPFGSLQSCYEAVQDVAGELESHYHALRLIEGDEPEGGGKPAANTTLPSVAHHATKDDAANHLDIMTLVQAIGDESMQRILAIISNDELDVEQKLSLLGTVDERFYGWTSPKLAERLGVTGSRVRQTEWWNDPNGKRKEWLAKNRDRNWADGDKIFDDD